MRNSFFLIFGFFLILWACNSHKEETPLAKVQDKYLYLSEVTHILDYAKSREDSQAMIKNYVDTWVKKQLLLAKAELNLTDEQKDVNEELEEYRTSLLTYRYEQNLLKDKIDTIVKDAEIQSYHNTYPDNFKLDNDIVKAIYVKLPKTVPNLDNLKQWLSGPVNENIANIESFCFQYAIKFDNFKNDWIPFQTIISGVPIEIKDYNNFLDNSNFIQTADSNFVFFIRILDFKLSGSGAPLGFVKDNIRDIILNKRKIEFLNQLENNIFKDAIDNENATIFYKP